MSGPCSVDGCALLAKVRGYCNRHYLRVLRYGDAQSGSFIKGTMAERFEHWVPERPANGCWTWTGTVSGEGYGQLRLQGSQTVVAAHRYAYEQFLGPIPEDHVIDHRCHTDDLTCFEAKDCQHRRCCNPAHMEPVTNSENVSRAHRSQSAQTHCIHGHEFTEANTYHPPDRPHTRQCRLCGARREEEYRRRRFDPAA